MIGPDELAADLRQKDLLDSIAALALQIAKLQEQADRIDAMLEKVAWGMGIRPETKQ